jgi:hypothetical protein
VATQQQLQNMADYLNVSVWSAYTRIVASKRFSLVAERGGLIPPDVAAVAMALLEYEKATYGNLVNNRILPVDATVTAEIRKKQDLPSGVSVATPFVEHLRMLDAAEIIRDEWVWHDMPPELYLINRPGLSAAERQILTDLGFADALAMQQSGRKAYKANLEAVAKADALRATYTPKFDPILVAGIVNLVSYLVVGGLIAWTVYKLVDAVTYRWRNAKEWEIEKQKADNTAGALRIQTIQAEANQQLLLAHCGPTAAEPWGEDECAAVLGRLNAIQPVTDPPPGPPLPVSCGFANCWPYALVALGGGAVIGGYLAKRRGWV